MKPDDAFLQAIIENPDDDAPRLIYADYLDERGHPGADYLRTEVALFHATGDKANLRRKLLEIIPRLPQRWRDRFEQPDLLLAPPVPFATGWYAVRATAPSPYRSLPNLDPDMLTPDMPWLAGKNTRERVYEYEADERASLEQVLRQSESLNLTLPPGFEALARDFSRRVQLLEALCDFCLMTSWVHDLPHVDDFHRVEDGYLVRFFADMDYGNPHQLSWALYLVPGIDWHCVVVYELSDEAPYQAPSDPERIYYCAPSFQAFLYRWWLACDRSRG